MLEQVSYRHYSELWSSFDDVVLDTAERLGAFSVAELGGGANPIIKDDNKWGFVPNRVVIDISASELAKVEGHVNSRVADLCQPITQDLGSYDVVFSKILCEHLGDAATFHRNCYNLLRPGGASVHFFPTLFAAPFVVNRLVPEGVSRSMIRVVQPGRLESLRGQKFPALYDWCTGPTAKTLSRFQDIGFEIEEWRAGYGHQYYRRLAPIQAAEEAKTRYLLRRPIPALTSFALIVLRKPA